MCDWPTLQNAGGTRDRTSRVGLLGGYTREDLEAGRSADAEIVAVDVLPAARGLDHQHGGAVVLDPARGLDAAVGADDLVHQGHVLHRGAVRTPIGGRAEAGRGLDEARARLDHELAGRRDLFRRQVAGLEDDFDDPAFGGRHDPSDVVLDLLELTTLEPADVENHVHLVHSGLDGHLGLVGLGLAVHGPEREADDHAGLDVRAVETRHHVVCPAGVDADSAEAVCEGLHTEVRDHRLRGEGLEERVVDHAGQLLLVDPECHLHGNLLCPLGGGCIQN